MLRKKWLLRTIVAGCAVSCAPAAMAADTVVRHFNAGDTATAVGIAPAVEDVELTGPQALTSDADGNLFVLDQINGRILRFDPKQPGSDPSILKMPADVQANDLVVRKSDILVWDGSIRTLKAASEQSTRGVDGSDSSARGGRHAGRRRRSDSPSPPSRRWARSRQEVRLICWTRIPVPPWSQKGGSLTGNTSHPAARDR